MRRAQRNTAFYKILLALFLATFLLAGPGKGYYLQRERYGRDDPDPDRELQ